MKVFFLLAVLGLSSNVFAEIKTLKCKVENPCAFKSSADLGYCLSSQFSIRQESFGYAAVVSKSSLSEVFLVAAVIPVSERASEGYRVIVGSTADGEDSIELYPKGFRHTSSKYFGSLTLEQDFKFEVTCVKK